MEASISPRQLKEITKGMTIGKTRSAFIDNPGQPLLIAITMADEESVRRIKGDSVLTIRPLYIESQNVLNINLCPLESIIGMDQFEGIDINLTCDNKTVEQLGRISNSFEQLEVYIVSENFNEISVRNVFDNDDSKINLARVIKGIK